jgi:Mono-functional DNA-alkylating methyl methanesulfonate N-term/CPSF A subunit region
MPLFQTIALHDPTTIEFSLSGYFTESEHLTLAIGSGSSLSLYRNINANAVYTHNFSSKIVSIAKHKFFSSKKDSLAIYFFNGDFALASFTRGKLEIQESFPLNKAGVTRFTPGIGMACDLFGRIVFLWSLESGIIAFNIAQTPENSVALSISDGSHYTEGVVLDACIANVGLENPQLICLSGKDGKNYIESYELELSTNRIVRKSSVSLDKPGACYVRPFLKSEKTVVVFSESCCSVIQNSKQVSELSFTSPPLTVSDCSASENTLYGQLLDGKIFKLQWNGKSLSFKLLPVQMTGFCKLICFFGSDLFLTGDNCSHKLLHADRDLSDLQSLAPPLSLTSLIPTESDFIVANSQQVFAVGGGSRCEELARTELPETALAVFQVKKSEENYICISFEKSTLVLKVGEEVEESTELDFATTECTVFAGNLEQNRIQVTENTVFFHVTNPKGQEIIEEWKSPKPLIRVSSSDELLCVVDVEGFVTIMGLDEHHKIFLVMESSTSFKDACIYGNALVTMDERVLRVWKKTNTNSQDIKDWIYKTCSMMKIDFTQMRCFTIIENTIYYVSGDSLNSLRIDEHGNFINSTATSNVIPMIFGAGEEKIPCNFVPGKNSLFLIHGNQLFEISRSQSNSTALRKICLARDFHPSSVSSFVSEDIPNGIIGVKEKELFFGVLSEQGNDGPLACPEIPGQAIKLYRLPSITVDGDARNILAEAILVLQRDSSLSVINPKTFTVISDTSLPSNDSWKITKISIIRFACLKNERPVIVVSCSSLISDAHKIQCFLYDENFHMKLLHETEVESEITAMCELTGKLAVSLGKNRIILLDLGQYSLVKVAVHYWDDDITSGMPYKIVWMESYKGQNRLFLGDLKYGVWVLELNNPGNLFRLRSRDFLARWIVHGVVVDPDTCIVSDKFNHIFILRISQEGDGDGGGQLLDCIAQTNSLNTIITEFQKIANSVFCCGINGGIYSIQAGKGRHQGKGDILDISEYPNLNFSSIQ